MCRPDGTINRLTITHPAGMRREKRSKEVKLRDQIKSEWWYYPGECRWEYDLGWTLYNRTTPVIRKTTDVSVVLDHIEEGDKIVIKSDVYLPYGSYYYGESRDADFVQIRACNFRPNLQWGVQPGLKSLVEKAVYPPDDADIVEIDTSLSLARECACVEYPDVLTQPYCTDRTVELNEHYRMTLFKYFPCDLTARKAIFAHFQAMAWRNEQVFIDRKAGILPYVPENIRAAAKRLLYHTWTDEDIQVVYRGIFGVPPQPIQVKVVPNDNGRLKYILSREDGLLCELLPGSCVVCSSGELIAHNPDLQRLELRDVVLHGLKMEIDEFVESRNGYENEEW
jgi:hypothetical protein